jgi:Flp pilus assembly protein TadG
MTSRMLRRLFLPQRQHRKSDATSGSAAVEFAMVLPVLMALVAGALNYGVLGLQMSTLISAARGGAEYAKGNPADASLTDAHGNRERRNEHDSESHLPLLRRYHRDGSELRHRHG